MKYVVVDNRRFDTLAAFDTEQEADKWAIAELKGRTPFSCLSGIFTELDPVPDHFPQHRANKSYRLRVAGKPEIYTYDRTPDMSIDLTGMGTELGPTPRLPNPVHKRQPYGSSSVLLPLRAPKKK